MPTDVDFGPCECCETSSGSGSGSGCDTCPDPASLFLDFEGTSIELSRVSESHWVGSGTPGTCVADWEFDVTCIDSGETATWGMIITNPVSATCFVSPLTVDGEVISCDPIEVHFTTNVVQPMGTCCLGGTFPRDITLVVTL